MSSALVTLVTLETIVSMRPVKVKTDEPIGQILERYIITRGLFEVSVKLKIFFEVHSPGGGTFGPSRFISVYPLGGWGGGGLEF